MWEVRVKEQGAWVELRALFNKGPCYGNILIIVAKDGYEWNSETRHPTEPHQRYSTKGIDIRISSNGPIALTFDELEEMFRQIEQAKELLK